MTAQLVQICCAARIALRLSGCGRAVHIRDEELSAFGFFNRLDQQYRAQLGFSHAVVICSF
jgi:hypothetical protein